MPLRPSPASAECPGLVAGQPPTRQTTRAGELHSLPCISTFQPARGSASIALCHAHSSVMGGPKSPYLYPSPDRPLSYPYSSYNPRAASQAAYQARQIRNIPQARQDGPLLRFPPPAPPTKSFIALSESGKVNYTPAANEQIQENRRSRQATSEVVNFNRHPDSWMIAHDQRKDYKPMPANTRKKVVAIRWVQFALRVVQELGAMGLLTCMICFTNVPEAFLWVMRVAVSLTQQLLRLVRANCCSAWPGRDCHSVRYLSSNSTRYSENSRQLCQLSHFCLV